jgi:hypothetical protein
MTGQRLLHGGIRAVDESAKRDHAFAEARHSCATSLAYSPFSARSVLCVPRSAILP